jgi:hypothetical protein
MIIIAFDEIQKINNAKTALFSHCLVIVICIVI